MPFPVSCFAAPGTAEIRLEKFLANPPCKLAGGVKEWVVRLPAALGGVGFVLASYFLGRDFYTACVGAIAAMVLAALFQRLPLCRHEERLQLLYAKGKDSGGHARGKSIGFAAGRKKSYLLVKERWLNTCRRALPSRSEPTVRSATPLALG